MALLLAGGAAGAEPPPPSPDRADRERDGAASVQQALARLASGGSPELVRSVDGSTDASAYGGPGLPQPAGDFDGDGLDDVLVHDEERVAGRRGIDGGLLFEHPLPSWSAGAVPADVGPAAAGGVVIASAVEGMDVSPPVGKLSAWRSGVRVEALDGDGAALWSFASTEAGAWLRNSAAFAGEVFHVVVDDLVAGPADDVVLFAADSSYVRGDYVVHRITALVLDGASGRPTQLVQHLPEADVVTYVAVVPDVSGDGLAELAFHDEPYLETTTLTLVSAATGQRHLSAQVPYVYFDRYDSVGDITGDGMPELALNPSGLYLYSGGTALLLDGRSGRTLAQRPEGLLHRLGDVDGDGTAEAGELHYEETEDDSYRLALAMVVLDARGGERRRSRHAVGHYTFGAAAEPAGDVDEDGVVDVWSDLDAYDDDGVMNSVQVVSGRTGQPLWERRAPFAHRYLLPVHGALDGAGDDLVELGGPDVRAVDGRTGREQWSAAMDDSSYGQRVAGTADLDGDGSDDLLLHDGWSSSAALSGDDGRVLWRLQD